MQTGVWQHRHKLTHLGQIAALGTLSGTHCESQLHPHACMEGEEGETTSIYPGFYHMPGAQQMTHVKRKG